MIVPYIVTQVKPIAVESPKINDPKSGANVVLTVSRFIVCIQDWATEKSKPGIRYESSAQPITQTVIIAVAAFAKAFAFNIIITPSTLMFMTSHHKDHHDWTY